MSFLLTEHCMKNREILTSENRAAPVEYNDYLLPTASSADSGSSLPLVSGSRKVRSPLSIVRLLNTRTGTPQ